MVVFSWLTYWCSTMYIMYTPGISMNCNDQTNLRYKSSLFNILNKKFLIFVIWVFSIFPKAFYQRRLPKLQLPIVQFPKQHLTTKVKLGPLTRRRLLWGRALRLGWARGSSAADRINLVSRHFGNCAFWKLPLGKKPLHQYLTS